MILLILGGRDYVIVYFVKVGRMQGILVTSEDLDGIELGVFKEVWTAIAIDDTGAITMVLGGEEVEFG